MSNSPTYKDLKEFNPENQFCYDILEICSLFHGEITGSGSGNMDTDIMKPCYYFLVWKDENWVDGDRPIFASSTTRAIYLNKYDQTIHELIRCTLKLIRGDNHLYKIVRDKKMSDSPTRQTLHDALGQKIHRIRCEIVSGILRHSRLNTDGSKTIPGNIVNQLKRLYSLEYSELPARDKFFVESDIDFLIKIFDESQKEVAERND